MGMISGVRRMAEAFAASLRSIENPASGPITMTQLAELYAGGPSASGVRIDGDTAMRHATFQACTRVRSEDQGVVPIDIVEVTPQGDVVVTDHSLEWILDHEPNEFMTSSVARETDEQQVVTRGNSLQVIDMDGAGRTRGVFPIHTSAWWYEWDGRRSLKYFVREPDGKMSILDHSQVVHIPGLGGDGIGGYSVLGNLREILGKAIAMDRHGAAFFKNFAQFGGVLEALNKDGTVTDAQWKRTEDWIKATHTGFGPDNSSRAFKLLMLDGFKLSSANQISPQDSQFMELLGLSVLELCRVMRVDPQFVAAAITGDRQTYVNMEQRMINHIQHTLMPAAVKREKEWNRKLFSSAQRGRYRVRYAFYKLLRGDMAARAAWLKEMIGMGVMLKSEGRKFENLPPIAGIDDKPAQEPAAAASAAEPAASAPAPAADESKGNPLHPLLRDMSDRLGRRQLKTIEKLRRCLGSEHWAREAAAATEDLRSATERAARPIAQAALSLRLVAGEPDQIAAALGEAVRVTMGETLALAGRDVATFDATVDSLKRSGIDLIAQRAEEVLGGRAA